MTLDSTAHIALDAFRDTRLDPSQRERIAKAHLDTLTIEEILALGDAARSLANACAQETSYSKRQLRRSSVA